MNDEEKATIKKYFELIQKSIDYHRKGQNYATQHLALSVDQVERGHGVVHGITETKELFVEMAEELHIKLV